MQLSRATHNLALLGPSGGLEICMRTRPLGALGEPQSDVSPARARFCRDHAFEFPLDARTSIGKPYNRPFVPPGLWTCHSILLHVVAFISDSRGLAYPCAILWVHKPAFETERFIAKVS